jgi:predicted transcriptional regulator
MRSLKVVDYMNRYPVSFQTDMTIERAADILLQSGQRGGPVIDAQRRLVGFLSEQDCIAALLRNTYHNEQSDTVSDCMYQGDVVTVNASDSIADLAQRLAHNRPKIYPVVDSDNLVIGVITRTDILRAIDLYLSR